MDLDQLTSLVKENNLVAGGVAVTVTGVIFTYVRNLPRQIFDSLNKLVRMYFFTSVEVEEESILFGWVRVWLHAHFKVHRNFLGYSSHSHIDECDRPSVMVLPGSGSHFGLYNRTLMWISYQRTDSTKGNERASAKFVKGDIYTITFLTWDASIIKRFLLDCRDAAHPRDTKIDIRMAGTTGYDGLWPVFDRIQPRSLSSIVLPDGAQFKILADIQRFLLEEPRYRERGIPYRRGYLLHGNAGAGKTSVVIALAGELKRHLHVISLAQKGLDDLKLFQLFAHISPNSIVLLEDIDCAFKQRNKTGDALESQVTFSGLLNVLDGVFAKEGRILFMTTNHIEQLDEALIRSGRIDYRLEFKNATRAQALEMWEKFFPGEPAAPEIVAVEDYQYSMAKIQEMLIHRLTTGEALSERIDGTQVATLDSQQAQFMQYEGNSWKPIPVNHDFGVL